MGEKLKKRTLVKKLTPYMEEMGYTMIKCGFGQGTFSKKVADDIYFTVDYVIHRFYDDQFTSDIYYAKSVHLYEDYYKYGRARLGCVILGSDTWWQALDDTEFLDYIATLKKAEEIIIGDQKITEDLNASPKENLRHEITAKINIYSTKQSR